MSRLTTLGSRPTSALTRIRPFFVALTAAALMATAAGTAKAGGDWNDPQIGWKSYEEGLAQASAESKPVFLVFFTEWCPHCAKYSALFHEKVMVDYSKNFVMIRVNKDQNKELSSKYNIDGEYIPRTFFLDPQGTLLEDIHAPKVQYMYFHNYSDVKYIMRAMRKVLEADATPAAPAPKTPGAS